MKNKLTDFLDEHNRLILYGKEPGISTETVIRKKNSGDVPEKTTLEGKWSITPEYDLKLRLTASDSRFVGRTLIFRGDIVAASSSGLFFRVRHCDALSGARSRTIQLRGVWALDNANKLTFQAARADGRYDVLRFYGSWKVNSNNELSYRLVKTQMKTRSKIEDTITFRGYWDLGQLRLVYRMDRSGDSTLSFRAALQSSSVRARDGAIRFRLGGAYSRSHGRGEDVLTIHGLWRLGRDLHVFFELKGLSSKKSKAVFGVEKLFIKDRSLKVSLTGESGKKLGLEVEFNRVLTKDAELFVDLGHDTNESRIMGGIRYRF